MDSVLILFKRSLQKVIKDPSKSFLVPNWNGSLKVKLSKSHKRIDIYF